MTSLKDIFNFILTFHCLLKKSDLFAKMCFTFAFYGFLAKFIHADYATHNILFTLSYIFTLQPKIIVLIWCGVFLFDVLVKNLFYFNF